MDDKAEAWWQFDYNCPPKSGLYWLAVESPEYDVDADDYGRTIGVPTGRTERFVAMTWLDVSFDGDDFDVTFTATDGEFARHIGDEDTVTHYMRISAPSLPAATPTDTPEPK